MLEMDRYRHAGTPSQDASKDPPCRCALVCVSARDSHCAAAENLATPRPSRSDRATRKRPGLGHHREVVGVIASRCHELWASRVVDVDGPVKPRGGRRSRCRRSESLAWFAACGKGVTRCRQLQSRTTAASLGGGDIPRISYATKLN
jgi:hypothetical protein